MGSFHLVGVHTDTVIGLHFSYVQKDRFSPFSLVRFVVVCWVLNGFFVVLLFLGFLGRSGGFFVAFLLVF